MPSAMMAFGIAADKVLKQVPPAQVQQQNLIVNMFGGLGKKLESSLSTVIVEHDKQEHEKPILTENVTPEPVPEPVTEPLGLVPESIPPVVVCEPELSSNLINPCK